MTGPPCELCAQLSMLSTSALEWMVLPLHVLIPIGKPLTLQKAAMLLPKQHQLPVWHCQWQLLQLLCSRMMHQISHHLCAQQTQTMCQTPWHTRLCRCWRGP